MKADKGELLRCTIELAIEDAICEVWKDTWPDMRDDCYGCKHPQWERRVAAVILTALYIEHSCNIEDLALEMLIDSRDRSKVEYPMTWYPAIDRLWQQHNEFINSPFGEGTLLRSRKAAVEAVMHNKLAAIDKLPTFDMFV